MKCIFCGAPLAAIDYCPGCGADITIQKRIVRISNLLYNEGLEKALVRDMKGAITCLKRSLKFNKENTNARNLLGLCYYETGEAVSALCEWVVSKNLQAENNLADYYLGLLQNNKNKLDTVNQTIRKYNQSVEYCRADNEDMAIIQLKKVINQNPKLVKAYQLLALLYMKRQEYERARKLLKKAAYIDTTNTTTLRYLQEIEDVTGKSTSLQKKHKKYEKEKEEKVSGTLRYMSGTEMVIQPTTFRDSSAIATFINIILGILLGGAIVWFLIVPANKQAVNDDANRQVTDANMKLANESVKVQELEDEISEYVEEAERANQDKEDALAKAQSYEDLLAVANVFVSGDQAQAANLITTLNGDDFDGNAKSLYESLSGAVQTNLFNQYYTAGTTAYVAQDYAAAAEQLQKAVDADPNRNQSNHGDALLYLGMSWYYLGNYVNANESFNVLIEKYPNIASTYGISGYVTAGGGSSGAASAEELSGLGDGQNGSQGSEEPIQIYDESQVSQQSYEYDYENGIYPAWTDPNTGIQYDVYGNPLPGQGL